MTRLAVPWLLTTRSAAVRPKKSTSVGTPRSRAEVNKWLALVNSDIHPAFVPLFGATAYLEDAATIEKTKDAVKAAVSEPPKSPPAQGKDAKSKS